MGRAGDVRCEPLDDRHRSPGSRVEEAQAAAAANFIDGPVEYATERQPFHLCAIERRQIRGPGGGGRADGRCGVSPDLLHVEQDRKSVVSGKSVSVRVDLGGRRIIKKKKKKNNI